LRPCHACDGRQRDKFILRQSLGIAAQLVLAIAVIFYVLPWMGLELLDTA
jgi:hypothetical protein